MTKHVTMWHGKPLTEYSKEELIGIVETLADMLDHQREAARQEIDMLRAIRQRAMQKARP